MLTVVHNCDNKKWKREKWKGKELAGGVALKCNEFDLLFLNKSNIFLVVLSFFWHGTTTVATTRFFFLLCVCVFISPLTSSSCCLSIVHYHFVQSVKWWKLSHFFQVIIIHSSCTDGRSILGRFQTTSQTYYDDIEVRATVESIVEFEPKLDSFTEQLMEMKAAQSRVYLLYAR